MNLRFAICDLRVSRTFGTTLILALALSFSFVGYSIRASIASAANPQDSFVNRKSNIVNPTVGMEGRVEVTLPGTLLEAKPVDPKSLIVLRIADTRPHGTLIYYDLRYVGLEPGQYDLRNYLARKDGSTTNDLPSIPVEIAGLLPAKHDGELLAQLETPLPFLGGYKTLIMVVTALWALVLIPLWLIGRRRKPPPPVETTAQAPTLADRLRPLIEQAAAGQLSHDGQAQLERLLLAHWRQRLNLEAEDMAEAISRLREHAEGGALLRELENWLHRPPGSAKVDVNILLEPYRNLAATELIPNPLTHSPTHPTK